MVNMFQAPIPGESLTREPGNAPWEQPPQFDKVEDVTTFYMDKFEDDETLDEMLWILDNDMPIELFLDTMLLSGEMHGVHTSDVSLLVGPVLHEHIKALADAAGVNYREFQGETKEQREKKKTINDVQMSFNPKVKRQPTTPVKEEVVEEVIEEEVIVEPPKRGLMKRRA